MHKSHSRSCLLLLLLLLLLLPLLLFLYILLLLILLLLLQVGGYSCLSTLVLIFNLLILFSVAKNKYLHYTTHYVMVALALRSVERMVVTMTNGH